MSAVGKLRFCIDEWKKYTDDPWILQTVAGYCLNFESEPFQISIPNEISFSEEQRKSVDFEIQELLNLGAIVHSEWEENQYVSNIFIVPKPNGRFRPIINLKFLNQFIHFEHFKQETFKTVLELIQLLDFFTSIDMKNAYFSVSVHPFFRRFLKFIWNGQLYHFVCVPFGLSPAPRLFTKILRPIFAWFRLHGIRCSYYIDDSINMNKNKDVCAKNAITVANTLESLGFTINKEKSAMVPAQRIVSFGFLIDSLKFLVYLTDEKVSKIYNLAKILLERETIVVRQLASFIGLVINAFFAVLEAPLHYRNLERNKLMGLEATECIDRFENKMLLSTESKKDLQWWIDNVQKKNGKRIRPKNVDIFCRSDASFLGWGAYELSSEQVANGRWTEDELQFSINYLELLAIFYALQSLFVSMSDVHIHFQCDNTCAVSYIKNFGGMCSIQMDNLAGEIWQWCLDRNIYISASHLSGVENFTADFLSRNFSDSTEWMLKKDIFDRICKHIFMPDIDLFASRLNKQLEKFVSWYPEPGCFMTDAFSFSWHDYNPYIFPPFSLIGRVVNKVIDDKVDRAILIIPFWRSQSWFPLVLSNMISSPVRLPRHQDLLTLQFSQETHPLAKKLTMVAVVLSGRDWRHREYQLGLQTSSLALGDKEQGNNTVWPGKNGIFGILFNVEIPFVRLKQL